ncbi:AAA family ATPase [Comamonas sp. Tr-654]|uniref:AAA family ATPase n=1 Tax=Comamonas sp. Tr-654 TaxID=2608341 RepID=UPI001423F818|nr:AAA family ATPase [Comamonas sp. Tr-654]NIF83528.1 AAA family ATPase [Comamonas sp. Tr-654]
MSIKISNLQIINYKSCKDISLRLEKYTPLVGYNNSGKSNIIAAIQWLLRRSALDESYFGDVNSKIEVIAEVTGVDEDALSILPDNQKAQISPFVFDGKLIIKRVQLTPNDRSTDIKIHVYNPANDEWRVNPTGIDAAIGKLLPEPIRIGAMEDAAEDAAKAKTTTTIGKLLAELIKPLRTAHEKDINQHLGQIEQQISHNGTARLAELSEMDSSINGKINDLFPGIGIKLHFPVPSIDDLIKAGTLKVYEGDDVSRDFSSYGHGTQRSIQMALVRHLAEVRREQGGSDGTTLLLIDEPELYLHPFAIEHIRSALKILSDNGYQIVFSTHSAQMIKSDDAQNTILIRKSGKGTYSRTQLGTAIQEAVPNSVHQMEYLFSLSHSNQILFADKVVLTEGKTEQRLLPYIFESIQTKSLGQHKTALVPQGGVGNTGKCMEILSRMDLPCKAIVDLDYAFNDAISAGFIESTDADIQAVMKIFQSMAANNVITLNVHTGLPKSGNVSASDAFEMVAKDPNAVTHIHNIHQKLKAKGIWVWTVGAIETPLGLKGKTEKSWAEFKQRASTDGLESVCADYASISAMTAWIAA